MVDYLGLAQQLKKALAAYTRDGGSGRAAFNQSEAVDVMIEKHEVCRELFWGFDWSPWLADGTGPGRRLSLLAEALEHVLAQPDGADRPRLGDARSRRQR